MHDQVSLDISNIQEKHNMHHIDSNQWWRGCVIYQIYPRSFQDSNNDGIGDLLGIYSRLEYIRDLGVDAIWIAPFFQSPMKDYGYDVSDYRAIDPMFGTMADFEKLIEKAHKLGLKLLIDLVLSHTSDQHPWFMESREDRDNPKADWYVWSNARADGTPPNNWLSIFGGSAWQWDTNREQYYLHNFLSSQPDLHFHNIHVQNALLDMADFWLQKGVDGFRLDTINFYFHDKQLRSNPPLPIEQRNASIAPAENPYNYQKHIYSKNQPENIQFLRRLRQLLDNYDNRVALGEVGDAQNGLRIMGEYTAGDDKIHMCYTFEFLESTPATAQWVDKVFTQYTNEAVDGWPCWAFSNHDVPRHKTRWQLSDNAVTTYILLLMCLRGSACIYQGEELGFSEVSLRYDQLHDPYGIALWPKVVGRDGCRTPMTWDNQQPYGGFSQVKPWLPVDDSHLQLATNTQTSNPQSIYSHYVRAIRLRHCYPALQRGEQHAMQVHGSILSFKRTLADQTLLCVFNLGDIQQTYTLPAGKWENITEIPFDGLVSLDTSLLSFNPWQYIIAVEKTQSE